MPLLNGGVPVPLHEIRRGSYVQLHETTWRQLESWTVLDKDPRRADAPRFQVYWVGLEFYPSTFHKEPSWPVWVGDGPPSLTAVAS
ncbi:hypothetical protein [Catenulispora pinisilvae]|uniref:hypothetical protein n=1 Tax=Catenulispora pinisilvae TaxID=2705253 RepID=UPI00189266FE|nr:hypothetical protein [Catenulispora pinisilvae]